ncbi:hypothetical protein GOP47_0018007 [Adiantum capillus-veneris]|uniref:Uncharacterized protein n=1 Tax=Adiantum capillus-veneris TaxID=13818 RepID=A0A9D4ZA86_ADICA|nr:hypothetical protein GOP47_0018007 [Adiantum capillus-veneris]
MCGHTFQKCFTSSLQNHTHVSLLHPSQLRFPQKLGLVVPSLHTFTFFLHFPLVMIPWQVNLLPSLHLLMAHMVSFMSTSTAQIITPTLSSSIGGTAVICPTPPNDNFLDFL